MSPRTSFSRAIDSKPSEWPQFSGVPRGPDGAPRPDRRNVTNPNLTLSTPTDEHSGLNTVGSASATPLIPQTSQGPTINTGSLSRRGSPHALLDGLSSTRSVPTTPLGLQTQNPVMIKPQGGHHTPDLQVINGRIATPNSLSDLSTNTSDQPGALSRIPPGPYDSAPLGYSSVPSSAREEVCDCCLVALSGLCIRSTTMSTA